MEMLSLPANQEYLVSKKAKAGGQNETRWKLLLFYPCRLTPSFYNVTWQALHDEGLMIYFLSWNVGIVPKTVSSLSKLVCAGSHWEVYHTEGGGVPQEILNL